MKKKFDFNSFIWTIICFLLGWFIARTLANGEQLPIPQLLVTINNPLWYKPALLGLLFAGFGMINFKFWPKIIFVALALTMTTVAYTAANGILFREIFFSNRMLLAVSIFIIFSGIRETMRGAKKSNEKICPEEGKWNWIALSTIWSIVVFVLAICLINTIPIHWVLKAGSIIISAIALFIPWITIETYWKSVAHALCLSVILIALLVLVIF
jgi:hypothetical protein